MKKDHLLCFYGDDFTGSTDAMEALTKNGLRTVLFLETPDQVFLDEHFSDIQCFGVAGISRTMSPKDMETNLRPIIEKMKSYPVSIIHYKICSTFDSSPNIGSIGKVIDIAKEVFDTQEVVPLLVSAPELNRYTVFGNHFATVNNQTYRLDRHPTMSQHPITPMDEADLIKHLSKQTNSRISNFDINRLSESTVEIKQQYNNMLRDEKTDVVVFDALNNDDMREIGGLIWEQSDQETTFVVGSSGVEYALTKHWKTIGLTDGTYKNQIKLPAKEQVLAVSGSCSPVTEEQIEFALEKGFVGIKVPMIDLLEPRTTKDTFQSLLHQINEIIKCGRNPIIYSALGSEDPTIEEANNYLNTTKNGKYNIGELLGRQLGLLIKEVVLQTSLKRIIIAGGDTSSYATKEMDIFGLEMIAPISPGAPLCTCYSNDPSFNGLELALKGGQLGSKDYFIRVAEGTK